MTNHPNLYNFTVRAALATGAGAGIGRPGALALAHAGALSGTHYNRSIEEAHRTLTQVQGQAGNGMLLQADLTPEQEA